MDLEEIVMSIIVNGGDAKSKALEAIQAAREGSFLVAGEKIKECEKALRQAHEVQTELLTQEAAGKEKLTVTLLMVHAQDHMMNALTTKDLALEMIEMYKRINKN